MSIKNEMAEKFAALSSEKEIGLFLNEIITALHDINNATVASLVKHCVLSEERATSKISKIDMLLKQIVDDIYENIKLDNLNKKSKAYDALKAEKDMLQSKVKRAKEMLYEKDVEIEKTRKTTHNEIKKKLQIGRDKVVAIAETSTVLGEQINSHNDGPEVIDVLNNIRANVGLLTEEMISLGLWDTDDIKPNVEPMVAKITKLAVEEEKTKEKTTKKTKATPKAKNVNMESFEEIDSLDDDCVVEKTETEAKATVEESQISLLDMTEYKKQEE